MPVIPGLRTWPPLANSLCPAQERRTIHESEIQIANLSQIKGLVTWFVSEEITERRTAFLGKLLVLYLIAIAVTMFAHAEATVEIMKAIIQDRPLLLVCGLMGVTAGLAIVLAHNVWSGGALPIIVTLFGWASLTKGMLLLVLSPETESRVFITGLGYEQHPNLFAAFALLVGAYMTYSGFNLKTRSLE